MQSDSLRQAYVHEAVVSVRDAVDPRAVGGAVTVALCGHWEHEGPCRWPHNNESTGTTFRTLFVCDAEDEPEVRARIRTALLESPDWQVESERPREVAAHERELADDLLRVPRRPE